MKEEENFHTSGSGTSLCFETFLSMMEPYISELRGLCRKITGSTWDAEDLFQDTLLKMFITMSARPYQRQLLQSRSYLFRVATNHWIDQCRKQRIVLDDYDDDFAADPHVRTSLVDMMDFLVGHLPSRQIVALILMDGFKFTASETADLVGTTEGAVHASLKRAKLKLADVRETWIDSQQHGLRAKERPAQADRRVVDLFITHFQRGDFKAIAKLSSDHATSRAGSETRRELVTNASPNAETRFAKPTSGNAGVPGIPGIPGSADTLQVSRVFLWDQSAFSFARHVVQRTILSKIEHRRNDHQWQMTTNTKSKRGSLPLGA